MNRKIPATLACLALLALSGCRKKEASRYTRDGLFVVRMQSPGGSFSELQIADSLGFWKQEGLKPEYIGTLTPGTEIPAALSGKVDLIGGHINSFTKAWLAGAKIHGVITRMVDDSANPHLVYHVLKKSGLDDVKAFVELSRTRKIKIAVSSRNTCSDWYFDEWLQAAGVQEKDIDWVLMPAQQQLGALSKGYVDVVTTHPPFVKPADADPDFHRVLSSFDIVHNPAAGAGFHGFTDKFIKEHPKEVESFVRVIVRVHQWSNSHRDSARQIFGRINKQPLENVDYRIFAKREWINDSDLNPWIERQMYHNDIKLDAKLLASDVYTNDYNPYWKAAGKPNTYFPYKRPTTQAIR